MCEIEVKSKQGDYRVDVQAGCLDRIGDLAAGFFPGKTCLVISDSIVGPLYLPPVMKSLRRAGVKAFSYMFPAGESQKKQATLNLLYKVMHDVGLTRTDGVVALGGGVTGDLGGFAAATYLRGIPYVQVPTSLLAQVDSSVGGKTGIDTAFGKNMVGAFYQPKAVLIDPDLLDSLPGPRLSEGMAEVLKYGLIKDADLFAKAKQKQAPGADLIARCVEIKAEVVRQDEFDRGERMLLNFGHTVGHAIEKATGYSLYTHGAAVAIGMRAAIRIGIKLRVTPPAVEAELLEALAAWDLPAAAALDLESLLPALQADKKWLSGNLNFILLEAVGRAVIHPLKAAELTELLQVTWLEAGVHE